MVKRAGGALLLSIALDPTSPRSVSAQLHGALRELILSGSFAVGERLPASRTLAQELGVSRTTVIEAFDRLTAEGLIEARVGAGAFVSRALETERPRPPTRQAGQSAAIATPELSRTMTQAVHRFADRSRLPTTARAFTTALPAFEAFPVAQWARLSAQHWRRARTDIMGYGEPGGHAQLIGAMLLNPGDKVWFENPGAIGARNSLIAAGAELVPVPLDGQGLRVDEGLRLAPQFRLAFVTPSHQQPLGMVLGLQRRFELLQAAARTGAWIIEDDYDGEFSFGGPPLPTLKSVDETGLVIHVGTFSKSLFPSLRLGYLLAPPALVEPLNAIMSRVMHGVPTHTQAVVADFIGEGHFAAHVRRMRRLYAERHEALCRAARAQLDGALEIVPSSSGLHTVGWLRAGHGEAAVVEAAAERQVTVSPLGRYAIAPRADDATQGLVLGFGGISAVQIERGVGVLAQVLDELRPDASVPIARRA
jgi:GntR family transcriptional regulator/MocR family aminotransferase